MRTVGSDEPVTDGVDAGPLAPWLRGMVAALDGDADAAVPCGPCTACCTSAQFVHIGPDEHETLARVPAALRFPAPGLPAGHVVMGYDERGHCAMFVAGRCSIYEDRPRTCRTYDCRVFTAADVEPDEDAHPAIAAQARRWRFAVRDESDRVARDAVRAAAAYVRTHADALDATAAAARPARLAVLAVEIHDAFVHPRGDGTPAVEPAPDPAAVRRAVDRVRG
jgi:Fe-S-cluster containining protein